MSEMLPMSEITTDETRTCEECSETYRHVACYWDDKQDGKDWNADLYTCPSCVPIVEAREKKEWEGRQAKERQQAKEDAAKAAWLAIVPPLYQSTDTAHPDYPQATHRKAIEWQKSRESGDGNALPFFGLIGQSGRCKTRVISQVMKRMIWSGQYCRWVNATEFQRLVQGQWSNESVGGSSCFSSSSTTGEKARSSLETFRTCGVLVFDDLGKGRLTDTVAGSLYDLIEERTAQGRVTLWTSNASLDDLLQMLPTDSGGPIVRRLMEFSTIIQL
jgi:DNA replication protein DnaC